MSLIREVAKLNKELDSLGNQYNQLVDDVSKMFDYQDGQKSHDMDYRSQAINELKEKKKQLEEQAKIELQMEKLKLKKEQRCILQSQADIIHNTRKAMKEIEVDRDLKEEKKKLEHVIAELLKAGHGCLCPGLWGVCHVGLPAMGRAEDPPRTNVGLVGSDPRRNEDEDLLEAWRTLQVYFE